MHLSWLSCCPLSWILLPTQAYHSEEYPTITTWCLSLLPWTSFMKSWTLVSEQISHLLIWTFHISDWWQHFIFQIVMLHWWLVMSGTTTTVYVAAYADRHWMVKWWLLTKRTSHIAANVMTSKWLIRTWQMSRFWTWLGKVWNIYIMLLCGRMGYSYLMIRPLLSNHRYG